MESQSPASPGVRFIWSVEPGGCRWSEAHRPVPMFSQAQLSAEVQAAPEGPWLVSPAPWGPAHKVRLYAPLRRRRDLHVEFARLRPDRDAEAMAAMARFASRFGLLGTEQAIVYRSGRGTTQVYPAEHLITWRQGISTLKGLTELIIACKRADTKTLRKLIRWQSQPLRVVLTYAWPGMSRASGCEIAREGEGEPDQEALQRWSSSTRDYDRFVEPTLHFLYGELNGHLRKHVSPRLLPEGGVMLEPDSLLGALYVLAAEQLSGVWPTNVCASCGTFFVPRSRSDQKTCSDACRQRLSRSRRNDKKELS